MLIYCFLIVVLTTIISIQGDDISTRWTSACDCKGGRTWHTASVLNNGKVLAVGRVAGNGITRLNYSQLYDPSTNTWKMTNNMNITRLKHTASVLNNGKVLIAGGYDYGSVGLHGFDWTLNSAELYDPSTELWKTVGSLNYKRYDHIQVTLKNGKVLVAGGADYYGSLRSAELYDPLTETWTITGHLNYARRYHTGTLLTNGKVLITGGSNSLDDLDSAELYDPLTGIWTITHGMNYVRTKHAASLLNDGRVLITGGVMTKQTEVSSIYRSIYQTSTELYDPSTETWTITGYMQFRRSFHTQSTLKNGHVLVTGGFGEGLSSEIYDPSTATWTKPSRMNISRNWHAASVLSNGYVLVSSGNSLQNCVTHAELYDSSTGTWINTGNMIFSKACNTTTTI